MLNKWLILLGVVQINLFAHGKDTSGVNIIHRVHKSIEEEGEKFIVGTEIHLTNYSSGKPILFANGTFLEQYSPSSLPSFDCIFRNETCPWKKIDDWIQTTVNEEKLEDFVFRISELQQTCENNNGGCQIFCQNSHEGTQCSCPSPGFLLSGNNKTCTPQSDTFSLLTGNEGSFSSHGYPYLHQFDDEIHWLIAAPQRRRIKLNIDDFSTEADSDLMIVYDNSDKWTEIKRWSGQRSNLSAESSRNLMWITFQSDDLWRFKGFAASYVTEGNNYNTLMVNGIKGTLSTTLDSIPMQLCLNIIYELSAGGTIVIFIDKLEESDQKFTIHNTRKSQEWAISRFLSPKLPEDIHKVSLSLELTGTNSKIFHIAECNPNDETDVYILPQSTKKPEEMLEPGELKQDETGNCHNGGTFLHNHGLCECPIGFGGPTCKEACDPNRYGSKCTEECSAFEEGCKNMIFCKYFNNTSSCTCASGFTGKGCNKECQQGHYGVNCASQCGQCRDGLCNIYSGKCNEGCIDGYYPPFCQERYVTLTRAPSIEAVSWNSIVISSNLTQLEGRGKPYLYQVQYKEHDDKYWLHSQTGEINTELITKNVTGLQPGTKYLFRVIIISDDGNRHESSVVPATKSETKCQVPDFAGSVRINRNINSSGFSLEWKYERSDSKWCSITGYIVTLRRNWMRISQNVSTEESAFTVSNLLPSHKYEALICAITKEGESCSSPVTITTKEREPGEVTHLKATALEGRKIKVSWNKPHIARGIVTGYILKLKCVQHLLCGELCNTTERNLKVNANEIELDNLIPLTQYKIRVAAVTTMEGPYTFVYIATKVATPTVPPQSSKQPIVSKTNTSATVQWLPPNCNGINGDLRGYHYILLAHSEIGRVAVQEGTVYAPVVSLSSLTPNTAYEVDVFVLNSQGWNTDFGTTIPFATAGTVPDRVEDLEIYKIGRRMLGIRWSPPKKIYGELKSFAITHGIANTEDKDGEVIEPRHCKAWSHLYCHTINKLLPNKNYTIEVRARNYEIDENGPSSMIIGRTHENPPDAPAFLKIVKATSDRFDMEWGLPRKFNGDLRAFVVNVEHEDSLNESDCCTYFPVHELPLDDNQKEEFSYNLSVSGLTPASRYVISVQGKTVSLGPNVNTTQYTAPLPPTNLVPPTVSRVDDDLVYSVKVQPVDIDPKIDGQYLVLVLPCNDMPTSDIWDEDLSEKLRSEVNESFYIVSEIKKDDFEGENEVRIGTGKDAVNGTLGVIQDPHLTPGIYRVGLAVVQKYNGAQSVGFVSSEPIEIAS